MDSQPQPQEQPTTAKGKRQMAIAIVLSVVAVIMVAVVVAVLVTRAGAPGSSDSGSAATGTSPSSAAAEGEGASSVSPESSVGANGEQNDSDHTPEPPPSDPEEATVQEAAPQEPEVYATPAYTITIPDEWRDDYTVDVVVGEPPSETMQMGFAWHVRVYFGPDYAFDVAAITDDWGLQGDFNYVKLGQSTTYPGWNVYVFTPRTMGDPHRYADYVST